MTVLRNKHKLYSFRKKKQANKLKIFYKFII